MARKKKTKPNQPRPPRNPRKPARILKKAAGKIALSTRLYAFALLNPFRAYYASIPPICVPDALVLPTFKDRVFVRGSGAVGTTGYGYLSLNPYPPTNNGNLITATSATSVMAAGTALNAVTNLVSTNFTQSKFANATLGAGNLSFRIVAAGIRLKRTGTLVNQGGSVFGLREPTNTTLAADSFTTISTHPKAIPGPFNSVWHTVRWKPSNATDYAFSFSTTASQCMAMVIQCPTAGDTFDFEGVIFIEWIGDLAGATSDSPSDPVGFSAASQAANANHGSFKGDGPSPGDVVSGLQDVLQHQSAATPVGVVLPAKPGHFIGDDPMSGEWDLYSNR